MKFSFRHKSSGFLYVVFERLLPWQMCNQFRRINLNGIEQIPFDTPVLIAANHPTAFIDPVTLGDFAHPPLYFMTRGDLFIKPWMRKMLQQFNMFPVNRARDGFTDPNRLDEATEYVLNRMEERQALCIFVEGSHHCDKRILPIQKGIARLAFSAYEKHRQDDLQVLPVGCSYWYTDKPRDVSFYNVGKPLFVKDYWEQYQTTPSAAVLRLCKDILEALKPLCFHINDTEDDHFAERLLELHRSEHPTGHFPVFYYNSDQFAGEKRVIEWVNTMPLEEKTLMKKKVKKYLHQVRDLGLSDEGLMNPQWTSVSRWGFLILCLPFFLIGWIVRFPIAKLANYVINHKIKKREFKTSIYFGLELFIGILWLVLLMIISLVTGRPALVGIAFSLPILYWFSIIYAEIADRAVKAFKARRHPQRSHLLSDRKQL